MDWNYEKELILQVQGAGCTNAAQELIEGLGLYKQVFSFVQRYLTNLPDVEEVTQETLSRAFCSIKRFDTERGRFRSWVFGIAMHQVYDQMRQRKHTCLHESRELQVQERSPEELTSLLESERALVEAVEGLKGRYRRVFVQYYVEGYSQQEIAALEGITANNVGTILNRARGFLGGLYERRLKSRKRRRRSYSKETQSFAAMLPAMTQRFAHT